MPHILALLTPDELGYLSGKQTLEEKMLQQLEVLRQEIAETRTVNASVITLLQGLKTRLDALVANAVDGTVLAADVQSLVTELNAGQQELANAVVANTPADGGGTGPVVTP